MAARRLTRPGSSRTQRGGTKRFRDRSVSRSSRPDQGDSRESLDSLKRIDTHLPSSLDLFSFLISSLPEHNDRSGSARVRVCVHALKQLETNLFDNSCAPAVATPLASDWPRPQQPLIGHAGDAALQMAQSENNRHLILLCGKGGLILGNASCGFKPLLFVSCFRFDPIYGHKDIKTGVSFGRSQRKDASFRLFTCICVADFIQITCLV